MERHALRMPSRWLAWLPPAAIVVVLVTAMTVRGVVAMIAPWLVLIGIIAYLYSRARSLRALERRVVQMQELAMLRHYPAAMRSAWDLMPPVATIASMHGRVLAVLAHCLDQSRAYESAIVVYDGLIEQLPPQHPGAVQLRIHRAIAQLQSDQLFDADDTLRGLRGITHLIRDTATGAALRLAQLIQQVLTNHFADAVASSQTLVDEIRPLGVEAAYGHALMALSFTQVDDEGANRDARLWWSRATLLMPAAALVDRFEQLNRLAAEAPSPQRPDRDPTA
jgi:hypothetical protein